jgi:HEPN domain-containing protein
MISSQCRRWLEFAADDLTAAKYLLSLYPFRLEIICYHCEQSAEKMLKAFLLMYDEEAPHIHDLGELCRLCALKDEGFDGIAEDCIKLTSFGVRVRYPFFAIMFAFISVGLLSCGDSGAVHG